MNKSVFDYPEDLFHVGVKALIKNHEGKILVLEVNKRLKQHWDLPGGRIHRGVSVEETLKREVFEELGIAKITIKEFFCAGVSNMRIPIDEHSVGLVLLVYVCEIDPQKKIVLSVEHQNFAWLPPHKAAEKLAIKFPAAIVEKIKQA